MTLQHLLLGQAYQLGYVTNDMDRALKVMKDYGVTQFIQSGKRPPIELETGGHIVTEGALAWLGPTMIEIILPVSGRIEVYTDWLPKDRFALQFHHIAMPIRSQAEWDAMRQNVDKSGKKILFHLTNQNTKALFLDTKDDLGHLMEYLYVMDPPNSWLTRIPQNIPGYQTTF